MRISPKNPDISNNPSTYTGADYSSGLTLTVKNTSGFSPNDYVIVGKIGQEQAEIAKIATVDSLTQFSLSSSMSFPHPFDTTVTQIPYNQWRVYRSTTLSSGPYSLLSTNDLRVDEGDAFYDDSTSQSNFFYQITFYNSTTTAESAPSNFITPAGYPDWSLKSIVDNVLNLFGDPNERFLTRNMVTYWVNECYRRVQYLLMGGESPLYINNVVLNGADSKSFDLSSYSIISIFMVETSDDMGLTWSQAVTPKDFRFRDNPGSISTYEYRLGDQIMYMYPNVPSGHQIRIWYTTNPVSLVNDTDVLSDPLKIAVDIFINWCLMRAHEKDRKMSELAPYYRAMVDKELTGDGIIPKLRRRIKQGNMAIATTWLDDYDQF